MRRHALPLAFTFALALGTPTPCLANGGKAKGLRLMANLDSLAFTADFDPYLFALTSAGGKYRVIRIKVRNFGSSAVVLSGREDTVRVEIDGQSVPGLLDLATQDAPFWDKLTSALRRDLAYPRTVDPNEEESAFVYIPNASVTKAPAEVEITYRIRALATPAVLRRPIAAAKH
jgi:hypothetical protein